MAKILDVSAITERIKARVTQIEDQLKQHQNLTDELERLRSALARLEGEIRTRVTAGRRGRQPASTPKSTAAAEAAAKRKSAAAPGHRRTQARRCAHTARAEQGQDHRGAQGRPEDRIRDLQTDRHRHRHRQHDTHQDGKGRRDRKSRTRLRTPTVANTR